MTKKEAIVKAPQGRVTRQSLRGKNKFKVTEQDPNYHYRFVNDIDDRIEDLLSLGYEFVEKQVATGDKSVDDASPMNSRTSKHVGNGVKGFLMRLPKEEYEIAQAEKNALLDQAERQMKNQTALDGNYGNISIQRKQNHGTGMD